MDFVPEVSIIHKDTYEVDADTKEMIKAAGFGHVASIQAVCFFFSRKGPGLFRTMAIALARLLTQRGRAGTKAWDSGVVELIRRFLSHRLMSSTTRDGLLSRYHGSRILWVFVPQSYSWCLL